MEAVSLHRAAEAVLCRAVGAQISVLFASSMCLWSALSFDIHGNWGSLAAY